MPGLKLFVSNRLEILAEKLAELLKTPLDYPLKKEIIVVQSKGMERWVSMQLACYHGICANCRFPFPNAIVYEIFRAVIPDLPEDSPFEPESMTWKIMKLLPHCIKKPGFESLWTYLEDEGDGLKRFQLSERIAYIFDQYLMFRPEMVINWEKGKADHWQAVLWRMLIRGEETSHRAAIRETFFKKIKSPSLEIKNLGERISVFGISALPPFHMEVMAEISKFIPVNLFLMNPCREYWGDIVSDREARKITRRYSEKRAASDALYLEKGNSLLASMGMLGRDFFDMVYSFDCEESDFFEDQTERDMLSSIQSDILNLQGWGWKRVKRKMIAETDTSIEIHSCHSPMREVEVLYDNLLARFEEDPGLIPKDILVMMPDIETYTPFIQAVFETPGNDSMRIPYSIADRSIKNDGHIITTFLAVFDLCGSRFGASQVINILESRTVQSRFGLSEAEVDIIKRWVEQTGIRWGIDEKTRGQMSLSEFSENTWKFGLDRLLLGYAMSGQEDKMFNGILPYDHIEGDEAEVLGKFLEFTEQLISSVTSLDQARTINEWSRILIGVLERFFLPAEDTEREIQSIRRILNELISKQEKSGFDEKIGLKIIMSYLRHQFEREGFGFGFMTGGVTFCTMLPMRSIPFKIICMLGMNNNAYPRQSKPLNFDLMAKYPKPGDRSRRNEDRYLFLEALLSARENLYISYVGQSIQDNSPIPPSVVVSELGDYIEPGFEFPGKNIIEWVTTKHRLQAFSPEYFKKGGKLFSYSEDNCRAARYSLEVRNDPVPFISRGLLRPDEEWRTVNVETLCRFFANPVRFFLKQRLGIYLEGGAPILIDREFFEVKNLEKYELEQRLLAKNLSGCDLKDLFPVTKASGKLPPGTVGECLYGRLSEGIERFAATVKQYTGGKSFGPFEVDLKISEFRLTGRIDSIFEQGLLHYRYVKVKAKDILQLWIYHLVLNSVDADNYPKKSMFIGLNDRGRKSIRGYLPVENSREVLKDLLDKYWEGLLKPLHFFPESSWEYGRLVLEKGKPENRAMSDARKKWRGSEFSRGEGEDVFYRLCFGKIDPLDSEFKKIAKGIFRPMLRHQNEIIK
ncbi:MAG: exodeoxyribonuclease V subunit gamma [Deltaproteobacteria bacterium]|nr:exodeoxyribonuclease V subunit gamma [Deltaproteobacteria bacterium]